MRNLKISLCQHPTTVVFIDDNQDYLTHLCARYNEILPCKMLNNPREALDYLNKTYHQHSSFVSRYVENPEDGMLDQLISNINIRLLRNEALLPNRFEEIAVVVIDYTMPGMNGVELRKMIINPNILIILLTGDADNDIAIKEFNNGTINKFLKKTAANLLDELLKAIFELEKQYFINQSNIILGNANAFHSFKFLEDTNVAEIFYKICQENNIVEHYILNEKGNFLLINKQGKPSWLALVDQDQLLDNYCNTAKNWPAPETIISALENKEKIPLFYSEKDHETPPTEWEPYLYPATFLKADKNYYYAYIPELNTQESQPFHTLSYQDFLAKI